MPDIPLVPINPDVPLIPDKPLVPLIPLSPEVPDKPLNPDVPDFPLYPLMPEVPDNPLVPDSPLVPLIGTPAAKLYEIEYSLPTVNEEVDPDINDNPISLSDPVPTYPYPPLYIADFELFPTSVICI